MRGQGDIAQYISDARLFMGKLRCRDGQSLINKMALVTLISAGWLDTYC